jgi:hypothetical protein
MALVFEDKVPSSYRVSFVNKVKDISTKLGIDPNWLMAIMYWESAKTFSPSIQNVSTGATGLIQFMPSTAFGLGTNTAMLKKMSAVEQLDWVYKYYSSYKNKLNNYVDTYFVTFFPLAVGKPDNYVLETKNLSSSLIATQNPAFDVDKNKNVQVWEVKKVMLEKLPSEWLKNGSFSLAVRAYKGYLLVGLALILGGSFYLYKKLKK